MNKDHEILELHKILTKLSDKCSNAASKQMALDIVPSTDPDTVKEEVDKTGNALELIIRNATPEFVSFKDIKAIVNRADSGAELSLKELIEVRRFLYQTRKLSQWKGEIEGDTLLDEYFEMIYPNYELEKRLEVSIIDENNLADEASSELASIRRKISNAELKIRETLDKMIRSAATQKYLQESIVTIRDGRYCLPVKTEHKGSVSGMVHDTSASGSTLFIEPAAVVEANNEIRILKGRELDEIRRIIKEFSFDISAEGQQLISSYDAAVILNVYFAKANLAADMNACKPEICDDGKITLNKARHPLIDKKTVVPVDFSIGDNYSSLIITGPNTGGKTVVLKTVGLLTLMTMCGLLIPVSDGSRISVFHDILVDIGDKQSIEMSLSTFSSHMNKVIEILEKADFQSLVLIDELGSGTDPVEGAALAVAIIEKLRQKGATLVTTTHYQELKMYAIDTEKVENASCEFDVNTLMPTYRLIVGSPGKSNAFAISKRLGLADDIIDHAKGLVSDDNKKFESIIDDLDRLRTELEKEKRTADEALRSAKKLKEEADDYKKQTALMREQELEKAREEAQNIVNRVQRESQHLVEELEKVRKAKEKEEFAKLALDAKQKQRSSMNKLYREANPVITKDDDYELPRPLKKGDNVILADSGRKGIIVTPPDNKGICFVQVGIMKTKIDYKKLRLVEKQPDSKKPSNKKGGVSTKGVESRMTRRVQSELDIRGYAADDGVYEVDNFLDSAVMSGITLVTIIHGKGTGVLKNAVRNHLKRHPHVKSARPGLYGEGEDGVTVVELKK
ncbi:MAG: endonuclease MutS2 [Ruminococcus sp.]|nr:endonuclease MutS2 [Ruminococcus sp.]